MSVSLDLLVVGAAGRVRVRRILATIMGPLCAAVAAGGVVFIIHVRMSIGMFILETVIYSIAFLRCVFHYARGPGHAEACGTYHLGGSRAPGTTLNLVVSVVVEMLEIRSALRTGDAFGKLPLYTRISRASE